MGRELVEADWAGLTDEEVRSVLRRYEGSIEAGVPSRAAVTWRSPRPMSAAALVALGKATVFIKRHHVAVRTARQLSVEHAFAAHLRSRSQPVPEVLVTDAGATSVSSDVYVYEVHRVAQGVDVYRDAPSWSPFLSLGHARAAGASLARFHEAARDFPLGPRPFGPLTNSAAIVSSTAASAEIERLLGERPGLCHAVAGREFAADLERHHLPVIQRTAPLLGSLRSQWGHGDWHASNLAWTSRDANAQIAGVFDLGLANRTYAAHDLAVALERNAIDWLGLEATGVIDVDLDAVDAFLDGYEARRPLSRHEAVTLGEVLPVVHLEYALSEIEYFAAVIRSKANTDLAYDSYLVGHTRWFEGKEGSALLEHLRQRACRCRPREATPGTIARR